MSPTSRLALCASLTLTGWFAFPSTASACGSFVFQETAGSMAGQQIFVGFGDDETLMVLSATYADASGEMAFLLPLASPPESVADGDTYLFDALQGGTAPRFELDLSDPCMGGMSMGGTSAGSGGGGGEVDVYDMGSTATYDYVVVGGDTGQSITLWLEQEGFAIPPELQTSLDPYVAQNWVFLAARLRADQARGTLAPLALSLPTMPPNAFQIPFAFGAPSVPEGEILDVTLYFAGPQAVVPANYGLSTIAFEDVELLLELERTNYTELFDAAVASDPEGAWVMEFAEGGWDPSILGQWLAWACELEWWETGTGGDSELCDAPAPDPWLGGAAVSGRITRLRTQLSGSQLRDITFQTAPAEDVRLQGTVSREADCPAGTGTDGDTTGDTMTSGADTDNAAGADGGDEGCGCSSRPTFPSPFALLLLPLLARRRRRHT